MQAANDPAETALMLEVAARTPWVLGVVGWVPLETPEAAATALAEIAGNPKLVGIRYLIHRESDPGWLSAPARIEALRYWRSRDLRTRSSRWQRATSRTQ